MRNTIRNTGHKWMLGLAMLAAVSSLGATSAHAAPLQFRVQYGAGYGENYVPPCPGEGYVWTAGYYNGGYWVPGAWVFQGGGRAYGYGFRGYDYDRGSYPARRDFGQRDFDRRRAYRDHDDYRRGGESFRGDRNDHGRDQDRRDQDRGEGRGSRR